MKRSSAIVLEDLLDTEGSKRKITAANICLIILAVILIAIIILTQIFSISKVSGESMRETIQSDDFILIMKRNEFETGDIVTAYTGEIYIVKRVIGVPGDKLIFVNNGDNKFDSTVSLYIDHGNGFELVDEPFIRGGAMHTRGFIHQGKIPLFAGNIENVSDPYILEPFTTVLGDDEYFLMGDNRDDSKDSRSYGPFNSDVIMGEVVNIISEGPGYLTISVLYTLLDWLGVGSD